MARGVAFLSKLERERVCVTNQFPHNTSNFKVAKITLMGSQPQNYLIHTKGVLLRVAYHPLHVLSNDTSLNVSCEILLIYPQDAIHLCHIQ